ncbi:PD-(D/E)XK nuclease family protein [Winogradskyella arenosi]|uniref:PD-(D/E)XK nuclease superfamily protein n=1 Tax=Winogradskyella arenosi TaxID=533325 RepID=A0A368ZDI3_9FLAO|nr:PD-(D/E)XK nuclease family protein [Winogradskyella arenosi]RCW91300.1 PD-(D/E)XK nuclease superfamily protein [Winogradskyella arenosi]
MLEGKEKINLESLQAFLDKNEIPKIKGKPKTFLGIAKQPHYENVLSNIYAFYLRVNEVHKFKDLFVTSLFELINKDSTLIDPFFDFKVFTEYGVSDQKRIDILLQNNEQAVIIENKVYHHLNNDLELYYTDVVATKKMGVVLSLHPISKIYHPYFINITHLQLLNQVMQNLGNYLLDANDKYVVFLKDFYQNTINLSQPLMNENDFNFYFENQQKINNLIAYKSSARKHLENEVKKAYRLLEGEKLNIKLYESSGNLGNVLSYYISKLDKNLMFTIIYGDLLKTDGTLRLIVELKGKALINKERYRGVTLSGEENASFYNSKNKVYAHFAVRSYKLQKSEIRTLGDVIYNKLKGDGFVDVFTKLEKILKQEIKNN